MREILFRGKRKDNGEWVEGYLVKRPSAVHIGDYSPWYIHVPPVDPDDTGGVYNVFTESIGQFTGLTDKNGKRIFEGDMFHLDDEIIAVVIFKDGCFRLEEYGHCGAWTESGFDECGGGWGVIERDPIDWYTIRDMEIIGNIHDNSELLGGADHD